MCVYMFILDWYSFFCNSMLSNGSGFYFNISFLNFRFFCYEWWSILSVLLLFGPNIDLWCCCLFLSQVSWCYRIWPILSCNTLLFCTSKDFGEPLFWHPSLSFSPVLLLFFSLFFSQRSNFAVIIFLSWSCSTHPDEPFVTADLVSRINFTLKADMVRICGLLVVSHSHVARAPNRQFLLMYFCLLVLHFSTPFGII